MRFRKCLSRWRVICAVFGISFFLNLKPSILGAAETDGLIGWWTFDEGTGDKSVDLSGKGNHVTLLNGVGWADGREGTSLLFTAPTHLAMVRETAQGSRGMTDILSTGTISILSWIYPLGWSSYGNDRGDILYSGSNAFRVRGGKGANCLQFTNNFFELPIAASAPDSIELNKWNFAVVTRNSVGEVTFYINGVQSGPSNQWAATFETDLPSNRGTCIGIKCLNIVDTFNGHIDDLRVYNRVVSLKEIQDIYEATRGAPPPVGGGGGSGGGGDSGGGGTVPPPIVIPPPVEETAPKIESTKFGNFENIFNPTKGSLSIRYHSTGNDVTLVVYDRNGHEIKTLERGILGSEDYETSWDGRNTSGNIVASGTYVLNLKQGSDSLNKKVVVIK